MDGKVCSFAGKPSTKAFLCFTAVFALCVAFVFWGTWSTDAAFVQPDNPIHYPLDEASRWWAALLSGSRFIPSDLMHVLGGMYFWQELQYALGAYLAALGMAFYLRGRSCSLLSRYAAGAAYGLMGYNFTLFSAGHMGWFVWLMYGPFAFGLVDRCVRKGKWTNWALLGAVLAWASAQQPDIWLMFTVFTFIYGIWCCIRERRFLKLLPGAALALAVMALTGAPQFRKALVDDVAGREAQMSAAAGDSDEDRWEFCTNWSLPPEDTLEFISSDVHGRSNDPRVSPEAPYSGRLGYRYRACPRCGNPVPKPPAGKGYVHPCGQAVTADSYSGLAVSWQPYRQHGLYMGLATILFAIAGIIVSFRRRRSGSQGEHCGKAMSNRGEILFWTVSGVVAYLCALGCFTPFYRLVYALPYMDSIRCPVKFVHILEWCVAALAGFGVDAAIGWLGARTRPLLYAALAAVAIANAADLARVNAGYCAKDETLGFFLAPNDAAKDAVSRGGGAIAVALSPAEGGGIVKESLNTHLADAPESAPDSGWRFYLVPQSMMGRGDVASCLRSGRFRVAGAYSFSLEKGIRSTSPNRAKLVMLEDVSVPAKTHETPSGTGSFAPVLTLLSAICGAFVLGFKIMVDICGTNR